MNSNDPKFNSSATVRAYRRAFWALLEAEQPIELPNKIPHHIKFKRNITTYERIARYEAETPNG